MPLSDSLAAQALVRLEGCADLLRDAWLKPRECRHKGPIDLVTSMDVKIQEELSRALLQVTPGVAIIGEEGSPSAPVFPDRCWVIDPIDGTTNFVHSIPFVGITASYCEDGKPVFAMTTAPMMHEVWYAHKGQGTFCGKTRVHVSEAKRLQDAVVATGFPYDIAQTAPRISARLAGVLPKAQGVRRMGAASLDLTYVCCGRQDAYYEGNLKPWDYMAGWLLVEEAGGRVTDDNGDPFEVGSVIVASNGYVHQELLDAMHAGDALLENYRF